MFSKTRECLICSNEFIAHSANGRYCSKVCRNRAKLKTAKLRKQGIFDYDFMHTIQKTYSDYPKRELTSDSYFVSKIEPLAAKPSGDPIPVPDLGFPLFTEPKTILVLNHKRDEERTSWR